MGQEDRDRPANKQPLLRIDFPDGSVLSMPEEWEAVFIAKYGSETKTLEHITERIRYITGKYVENQAWPSKFDGLHPNVDPDDPNPYENPDYYVEHWEDWPESGLEGWGENAVQTPPTWAQVADAVVYQGIRLGLMQKAMDRIAAKEGVKAPRVFSPQQFLDELERHKKDQAEN